MPTALASLGAELRAQGWELALEQDVYTPEGKRRDIVDRSPTARLVASLARHYEGEGSLLTLEAVAGVRGPSAGGQPATAAIHHIVHAPVVAWSRPLRTIVSNCWRSVRIGLPEIVGP